MCCRVDLVCAYAWRPRFTRRLHDCQRASRKLSLHAVVLCASYSPLHCPGATRPRQACSQSSYLTLLGCQLLSQGGPGVRLARHRRQRQKHTVRYARRPRRTLYLHDCQCASRKLSVHAVALCAVCPPLYCPGATRPTSGDRRPRRTLRAEAAAYAMLARL